MDLYVGTIHKYAALISMSHEKHFICDHVGRQNRRLLGEFEVVAETLLRRISEAERERTVL